MSETFLHGVQVLEVDSGARPIRTVRSSVIGLVGTGNDDSSDGSLEIGTGNAKLKITPASGEPQLTLLVEGAGSPAETNRALSFFYGNDPITGKKLVQIIPATNSSGVITSTASQIVAAFAGSSVVNTHATCELGTGSNGSEVVSGFAATDFPVPAAGSFPLDTPVLVTSPRNIDAQLGADTYLGKALEAIYTQAGAVCVVVRTEDVAGDATDLTGVHALKRAQSALGYTPRIIVAEGAESVSVIDDVKSAANALRAVAIVGLTDETSATDATGWVTANGNERVFALWPSINGGEDPAPHVAGVIAKSDNERGFWWSPSNREVLGIESLDSPVDFQLGDSTSLANILNEGKVTTFIRQGGFRVWGNMTGSIDPKWQFLMTRRIADIINDSILANHLWAVDRNITRTYLEDVSDGVNAYLATLVNLGAILGGRCWPDPDLNSPDQIALGKVYFNFEFTPPYPAQTVTFRSILTNDYLTELVD